MAVLCECMGGYREGDVPHMGLNVHSHITLHNSVQELLKQKKNKKKKINLECGLVVGNCWSCKDSFNILKMNLQFYVSNNY